MPIDSTALLKGLKPVLKALDADLLSRAKDPGVEAGLKAAWERERAAGRTAANFKLWCRRRTAQVSIAWVLSVVFVRTLEDRDFLTRRRIAGPGAEDSEQQFTALAPFLTPRDYLLMVFGELAKLPGATDLFDARHNPVWVLAPSADVARQLLDFFRHPGKKGEAPPVFDGEDTRFLGDLYQKLSADVRKRFALLQTPEFVEEFILEQTLDPAVKAFGLEEVRLIDPTCGSGHFLLGAFHRLFDAWQDHAPGEDRQVLAQRALNQVYGCDLNPYAVAIARFRLTLEFLQVTSIDKLERAPRLSLNLCVADTLLHGVGGMREQMRLSGALGSEDKKAWGDQLFALEDEDEALRILTGRYHAVVGNPPYVRESDTEKRRLYLKLYESAQGKYTLSAPFVERFFSLAGPEGFVGLINANAFSKRDFGERLICSVLPRLDLAKVVDSSGAYIPGHGTPTLMLFGRNRPPAGNVLTVLGKRGERSEPPDPENGPVWREIREHHDQSGFDGRFISVESLPREALAAHPWVLVGGGARQLKEQLESGTATLFDDVIDDIGVSISIGHDEVFLRPRGRRATEHLPRISIVVGKEIRDWQVEANVELLRPFSWPDMEVEAPDALLRHLWPWRRLLQTRILSGTTSVEETSRKWFDVQRFARAKHQWPLSIVFAAVATHNHFFVDRGSRVFKKSAPVAKLPKGTDEDTHRALTGFLNSSLAGLWFRLVMFPKGGDQMGDGGRVSSTPWQDRLDYAANLVRKLPVPDLRKARESLCAVTENIEREAAAIESHRMATSLASALRADNLSATTLRHALEQASEESERHYATLVSLQEELDWRVYRLFELPTVVARDEEVLVGVRPEHRPFEVRLAREVDDDLSASEWFRIHRRQPPSEIGGPLTDIYQQRLRLIDEHKELQLLETPETKRRWSPRDYQAEMKDACRDWLLDRIELLLAEGEPPKVQTARRVAGELQRDHRVQFVCEIYTGESAPDFERVVSELTRDEGVPFLASHRYTTTGLEKHASWCETWRLQRREDSGESVGLVPVAPKYANDDFLGSYWAHRGQFDVPNERFTLYTGAETDNDTSPSVGWAGWDHLQKATALSGLYQQRKAEEGWEKDKLIPLLAGLHELVPWLIQWHNDPSEAYGGQRLGDFFRDFVSGEAHALGCSTADLEAWRPPEATRGRNSTKKTTAKPKLTSEALLAAFDSNGAELAQADLAKSLGVSSAAVGKVAKSCIEAGQLVQTNGRPKRFALPTAQGGES